MTEKKQNKKNLLKHSLIKNFEYTEGKRRVRAAMLKMGEKYGVVMFSGDTAYARDYKNLSGNDELRTYIGNESEIIDWVSESEADLRYVQLLTKILRIEPLPNVPNKTTRADFPTLRLVQ